MVKIGAELPKLSQKINLGIHFWTTLYNNFVADELPEGHTIMGAHRQVQGGASAPPWILSSNFWHHHYFS